MNDTLTGMKQATTQGDILSMLFKSKNGASLDKDGATGEPVSFQSVLQASLKSNKNKEIKTNSRTSLQAIIQKKAESNAAARKLMQAKIAGQNEQAGTACEGKAADISMNDAMSDKISDLAEVQSVDLTVMLQTLETVRDKVTKLVSPEAVSKKALPEEKLQAGLKIKDVEAGKLIELQKTGETENAAASSGKSSEKGHDAVPAGELQVLSKNTEAVFKNAALDSKADVEMSKTGTGTEEKIAQLEAAVVKMIEKETEGLSEKAVSAIATQISPVIANFVKLTVNMNASQDKETTGTKQIETETLFKAKIADVLTGNGFDKETAEQIAGQIKSVTVAGEKPLPEMNNAAKSAFSQMLQKEADAFHAGEGRGKPPEGSSVSSSAQDKAPAGIPVMENAIENAGVAPDSHGKEARDLKDIKRDGSAFALSNGNQAVRSGEAQADMEMNMGFAQEEFQRDAIGQARTKSDGIEQIRSHETIPHLSVQQASASGESQSTVQPVRAQDIIAQIADLKSAQPDQTGRVKVVLDPPNLGTVEMDIIVRGDRVNAVMIAETKEVRQILQSHAEDLKQALSDQGFRIDRIEVKQPEEKGSQQWAGNGREWNQQQQQDGGYRQRREREQQSKFDMSEYMTQVSVMV